MNYVKANTPLWLFALPCVFAVFGQASAQQAPRLELSADTVLVDEPVKVAIAGLKPGQDVTIRINGNNGVWRSSASFRADAQGHVEVPEPMKLLWSATGTPPAGGRGAGVLPLVWTAEIDGAVVATDTLWRRAVSPGVRVVPVRERGLVGVAYFPPGAGPHPAMIVLGGSTGGIPGPGAHAGGLASRGYVVLALAFFNAEGLPPLLNNIPLEYFATAIDWLKSQASVDSARIGVLGTSRGGELALLLGSMHPALRVVVANVPSNVLWPGLSEDNDTPAWTLNGEPLSFMPTHFGPDDAPLQSRDRFLKRMKDPAALARAEIPVERINGPVLLFSGKDDQVWPSDIFAARVVARLKSHAFKYPVEHYSYENAGHTITRPYVPTTNIRTPNIHPVSHRKTMFGGTPEGQARANEDSWKRLLVFLEKYLKS